MNLGWRIKGVGKGECEFRVGGKGVGLGEEG